MSDRSADGGNHLTAPSYQRIIEIGLMVAEVVELMPSLCESFATGPVISISGETREADQTHYQDCDNLHSDPCLMI